MTSQEARLYQRSKQLLFSVVELPAAMRDAYLSEHCDGDTALLDEVRSLLSRYVELDGFLEAGTDEGLEFSACPEQIGPFRIHRVLGQGGMGIVYLAEQPSPKRKVALKVLRLDTANEIARARFAREAEVLARFQHPGIAHIYSAEVVATDVGPQPVICMEYVDGCTVLDHARKADLDLRARIELVIQLSDAVSYAHERGVLHRDIKPDNVLVDGDGKARILDFGIAHVAGDNVDELMTRTGQVLGTVSYMSPEQARGGRVDERSDLFSLGVILYELLTGELPFNTRGALVHQALRTLAESDPIPLSRREPGMRGDLETILSTALATEPARRYARVADLAADLRAFLDGRPIAAQPPSQLYFLKKFAQRHWALCSLIATMLLALGGGAGVAWQALTKVEEQTGFTELFADRTMLAELRLQAEDLWPANSTMVPALNAWLQRADSLMSRLDRHRERIAETAALGADFSQSASVDPKWLLGGGRALIEDLEDFGGATGLREQLRKRRAGALALNQQTIGAYQVEWAEAAIRVQADPRMGAYTLVPSEGLVPLGPDPASGLEEFAVFGALGEVPVRDAATGELELSGATTVVLVLVPGGELEIGDPGAPDKGIRYVTVEGLPLGKGHAEGPAFSVELDPYMLSKYELTQGQFLRAFGFNPSDHGVGDTWRDVSIDERHPVESVSWDQLVVLLPRLGLGLPTEAQWESAARAGAPGLWIAGKHYSSVVGFANLSSDNRFLDKAGITIAEDGHFTHSPVGTWAPNPYGLYDVLGNVWEFCADNYKVHYHELDHAPMTGLVVAECDGDVSRRGGAYLGSVITIHAFVRGDRRHGDQDTVTGARPIWAFGKALLNHFPQGDTQNR